MPVRCSNLLGAALGDSGWIALLFEEDFSTVDVFSEVFMCVGSRYGVDECFCLISAISRTIKAQTLA